MKRLMRNKNIMEGLAVVLGGVIFALAIVGSCILRDWNIENQCNNGNTSMCEIRGN